MLGVWSEFVNFGAKRKTGMAQLVCPTAAESGGTTLNGVKTFLLKKAHAKAWSWP